MKTEKIIKFSKSQILKLQNFNIVSMMEELGMESIPLEILNHGKCRVWGCENIHHLDWETK